ncbi:uncharacterized protein [Lolium perenne]|uniref:uncharacterized protein n=1 Tax=Lolium perenne TaxID=4522 RepID=UPI0021F595B6|nr:uncharacterized protein LOC127340304 [Lolium perenne]
MEGETQPPPPPPPAEVASENPLPPGEMVGESQPPPGEMVGETQPLPACVSKVLDDDDLLAEIIVRVGFPTSLVRAAAVCRRWLGLASGRAFLRRFRKLHPPRLLGFYLEQTEYWDGTARFFPMLPQPSPPELAAVVRRASFSLDFYNDARTDMVGCWNGRVVTCLFASHFYKRKEFRSEIMYAVHSPLCSERGMAVIPALNLPIRNGNFCRYRQLFSKEEGHVYVMMESTRDERESTIHVYMLQNGDDAWRMHLTLAADNFIYTLYTPNSILVDDKIYMPNGWNEILVLDLTAASFTTIQLPEGVDFRETGTTMLSRADDASAVYLIHARELQLRIWLHKGGNWLLVDNICLREMCTHLLEDEPTALLKINHMGDYTGEFLFLEIGQCAHYLDVKCRTLHKVFERTEEDVYLGSIFPFMMSWPPIFPALKDGPASNSM